MYIYEDRSIQRQTERRDREYRLTQSKSQKIFLVSKLSTVTMFFHFVK